MPHKEIVDLALASYLSVRGHKLVKLESAERGRTAFVFEDSPQLTRDTLSFYNRSTKVDALSFAETLKAFKAFTLRGYRI